MTSAAVTGTRKQIKEMADGTIRVSIDIDPEHKKTFMTEFGEIDTKVALALMMPEHRMPAKAEEPAGDGKFYQALHLAGFFLVPKVCQAVGTDAQFLDWIRQQPKSANGKPHGGDGDPIVPAHVRRVANGSGTGVKPPYSAIPLLQSDHAKQHQHGESVIAEREQWDKWRVKYLTEWVKSRIYEQFGVASLTEISQGDFLDWVDDNGLMIYVPQMWRTAA